MSASPSAIPSPAHFRLWPRRLREAWLSQHPEVIEAARKAERQEQLVQEIKRMSPREREQLRQSALQSLPVPR